MASRSGRSRSGAYLPLYVGDYLRDTQHLNEAEDGVYHRLLMAYWSAGEPLPADDRKLAAIARVSVDVWVEKYKPTIQEFFRPNASTWHQKRMDEELRVWRDFSKRQKAAALSRWSKSGKVDASALPAHSSGNADAMPPVPVPVLTLTPTLTQKEKRQEKRARFAPPTVPEVAAYITKQGYQVDAQQWHDYYTANGWKVGKNAMKDWQAAVRTWSRRESAVGGPKKYSDEWIDQEFKAGRLKLNPGESYYDVRIRLMRKA